MASPPTPSALAIPPSVHFFSGDFCQPDTEYFSFPLSISETPAKSNGPDSSVCNAFTPPDNYTSIGATGCPDGVQTHLIYFSNSECNTSFSSSSGPTGKMGKNVVGVCWPPPIEAKLLAMQIWCGDALTETRTSIATSSSSLVSSSVKASGLTGPTTSSFSTTATGNSTTVTSEPQTTTSSASSTSDSVAASSSLSATSSSSTSSSASPTPGSASEGSKKTGFESRFLNVLCIIATIMCYYSI